VQADYVNALVVFLRQLGVRPRALAIVDRADYDTGLSGADAQTDGGSRGESEHPLVVVASDGPDGILVHAMQRPPECDPDHLASLTPREQQVARYVAYGMTNPEIAQALRLSPRTVEHHVAAILRKLELTSRRSLVVGSGAVVERPGFFGRGDGA